MLNCELVPVWIAQSRTYFEELEVLEEIDTLEVANALVTVTTMTLGVQYAESMLNALSKSEVSQ
jgi:hypothetical protein